MKGVVVYRTRYGATEQYAQWLGQILQFPVYEAEELSAAKLNEFDIVVAGGSVYVGKIQIAKWINTYKNVLATKKVYLFVVCGTPPSEADGLNPMLVKNIEASILRTMTVFFLRGRMIKSNLSSWDRFTLRMGASLQSKADKERMLTDFDDVKKENLAKIVAAVSASLRPVNV